MHAHTHARTHTCTQACLHLHPTTHVIARDRLRRIACTTWKHAYQLLTYVTHDVQRRLGVRCRPAVLDGVPLTRAQMARLAQNEGSARQPHILRASGPLVTTPRGTESDAEWKAQLRDPE